ncbi:MAG: T9SS type A sorting domain-containing protein [candidate division Zixibacteria bacterium]|nr:T9SS type A sorting domain-containing protein [candidate division Zixibacteria bacterium]
MIKLLTVCLVTVTFSSTFAYNQDDERPIPALKPNSSLRVHRSGDIALSVTNYGVIGLYGMSEYDPESLQPAPSARFPTESICDYLFFGSVWIGAEVEDSLNSGRLDTLVSVASDCWWYEISEMQPSDQMAESIWRERNIADEEIYATYCDTLTDPDITIPDPADKRPHIPLGLKITQHSLAWNTQGYDEFVVINYYIENIFQRDLQNVWLGIFYNGDVGCSFESYWRENDDDICGFSDHNGHGIGWIIDNDGEPYNGRFDYDSADDIIGLILAGSTQPDLRTNFNWWISDVESAFDWGPQRQSNFDIRGSFPGGGRGTPAGDKAKYQIMSNGEIDYDQAFSALDWTLNDWIDNSSRDREDLANGFDTRFLLSFGPFNLEAKATETLTVALIAGEAIHYEPDNYEDNLRDNTDDSLSIVDYYERLDFSGLYANADTLLDYYTLGFERIPPGPPDNFGFYSWGVDQIVLTWNRFDHVILSGYHIYRGIEPGVYDPEPITPFGFTDTVFIDEDILDNTTYYYKISSVNTYGSEGGESPEISINSGQPHTPSGLTAEAGNARLELEWDANTDDDLFAYIIHRKISGTERFELIDTLSSISYLDDGLHNGYRYCYRIQALDIYGNLSYFSDTVTVIPMAFDSGIMLINANIDWPDNPDADSMAIFYDDLLAEYEHIIVYECPEDLPQLSPYSTIIWCKEIIPGRIGIDQAEYTGLFADYLEAGGKLIVAGARILLERQFAGSWTFEQFDFQYKYLNLEGVVYPSPDNTEFVGGQSLVKDFPGFYVDTTKAARIVFPSDNDTGRLFGIGSLIPRDTAEIIYNYISIDPDTSLYHNRPLALIHETEVYKSAVLEFPLYYIEEPASRDILTGILEKFDETVDIQEKAVIIPEKIELLQNYPNPFNYRTEIRYILPFDSHVTIEIYDILGRSIVGLIDEFQFAGQHSVIWDGRNSHNEPATSGIYFYRLTTPTDATAKRMVYLK